MYSQKWKKHLFAASGVATRGQGGQSATPDSEKFAKNWEKEGKNLEKKRKNREEKAKIGKVLSLCPWQIGLATLLFAAHIYSFKGSTAPCYSFL